MHGRLLDLEKPRLIFKHILGLSKIQMIRATECFCIWTFKFVMQCVLIPVDEQVMNVETLPVGLSMMSADSIVNPRGWNI